MARCGSPRQLSHHFLDQSAVAPPFEPAGRPPPRPPARWTRGDRVCYDFQVTGRIAACWRRKRPRGARFSEAVLYQKTTLDNGLRIVSAEVPHARSVSTSLFIAAGSRHESDEVQGISHFIEHMLFKGTEKRPTPKDVSEAVEGIGGIFNAESGKEVTVYWNKVARVHWPIALEVLTDLLLHSLFKPEEVEKERKVIIEELSMLLDTPGDWVHMLIDQAVWGDHALGRDVGGTRESVSAIQRDQMLSYLRTHYVPANTVVAVAGAVGHAEVVDRVGSLLLDLPAGPATRWREASIVQSAPRVEVRSKHTEQAHLCLAVPGLSYVDPDRFALDLLNIVLGEGMSSRLFLQIREQKGLAYDVHSYTNYFSDTGSVVIYAGVDPKRAEETVEACLAEVERLKQAGVDEDELGRAKEFWKGRTLLRLEDTRSIAAWLGSQELLLDRVLEVEEVVEKIEAVTTDAVQAIANRLFVPERLSLAAIGPYRSDKRFMRLLSRPSAVSNQQSAPVLAQA